MQANIQLKFPHCDVSDALKEHAYKQLEKIAKHFDHIIEVRLAFEVINDHEHQASAHVILPHKQIHAEAVSEQMYTSINHLVKKLDKMILEYKEKMRSS